MCEVVSVKELYIKTLNISMKLNFYKYMYRKDYL